MPDYNITTPDGSKYKVTAPEGATQEQVLAYAKQHHASQSTEPHPSGFMRGAAERMLGTEELINNLGVGKHIGLPSNEILEGAKGIAEEQGKGTGVTGTLEELAGDPLTYAGGAMFRGATTIPKMGMAGARMGAAGGLTEGGNKPQKNIRNALYGGAEGAVVSTILPAAGKVITSPVKTAKAINEKVIKPTVNKATRTVLDSENPLIGGGIKKSLESPAAKEGERLGKKIGINFSTGELTGNQTALSLEDALANSQRWAGRFAEENEKKTIAIVNNFKKILDKVYPQTVSSSELGEKAIKGYESTITSLKNTRAAQANMDFKVAREATGDRPIVDIKNTIGVLERYVKEGESPLATAEQKAAANEATNILNSIKEKPQAPSIILDAEGHPIQRSAPTAAYKKVTVSDVQNGLEGFGASAKAPQGIFKAMANASDRRFAGDVKSALEKDADVAPTLKQARANYRKFSEQIGDIQKTALGKIIGGAEKNSKGQLIIEPEKVAAKLLAMKPTELNNTLKFLDTVYPNSANMARRHILEASFKKATEGAGLRGQGTTKAFGKAHFVSGLPDKEKLTALMGNSQAAQDVKDIASAVDRMIDWGAGEKGSKTAQRTDILSRIGSFTKHIHRAIVGDSLTEDLLNPQKRKILAAEAKNVNGAATNAASALGAEENPLATKRIAP